MPPHLRARSPRSVLTVCAWAVPLLGAASPGPDPGSARQGTSPASWPEGSALSFPSCSSSCSLLRRLPGATPPEPICNPGLFVAPPGWVAGDTHGHVQRCLAPQVLPEEREILTLAHRGLAVSNQLVWGNPFTSVQDYLQSFVPLVTGQEAPATAGDPTVYLQYGVELSGFHAANLGHVIGLGVTSAQADVFLGLGCPQDDGSGDFAAPILDHFRGAPDAVTGCAHVTWPVQLTAPRTPGALGWNWEDPALPAYVGLGARCSSGRNMVFPAPTSFHFQPFLAAFDAAMGLVDFVETVDLEFDFGEVIGGGDLEERWFGLYYKLLGAGLRVGIGAGSDTDCYTPRCEPRVWVRTDAGPAGVDYGDWLQGLKAGRASLAAGSNQVLELTVEGAEAGDTLEVASGGPHPLQLRAVYTLVTQKPVDETLEILVDGARVASRALTAIGSGTYELVFHLAPTESTWIVARTGSYGAHTAAVYLIVDGEPIVDCATAEYWTIYADYVNWLLDVASQGGFLHFFAGCSEAEIRAHVAAGRQVFTALRDYDSPLPPGAVRLDEPTPSPRGPPGILVDDAVVAGSTVRLSVFNAPSDAVGLLLLGPRHLESPYVTPRGARIHVSGLQGTQGLYVLPVSSNGGGLAERLFPNVPVSPGETWYAQFYFPDPAGDSASACLRLVAQ